MVNKLKELGFELSATSGLKKPRLKSTFNPGSPIRLQLFVTERPICKQMGYFEY